MYRKIVKSDFLAVYLPFAIMFGVSLVFWLFSNYIEEFHYDKWTLLICLLMQTFILIAFPIVGFGFLTARFYNTIAGGNAYFTFAIPARIDTILLGKLTVAFGFMAAAWGLYIYTWWTSIPLPFVQQLVSSDFWWRNTIYYYDFQTIITTYKYGFIAVAVLSTLTFVLQMMFAVSFSQMFKKYRLLIACGAFCVLYFLWDKATDFLITLASNQATDQSVEIFENVSKLRVLNTYFNNSLTYGIVFSIIFCILLYVGTRTILTKKLNL